MDARSASLDRVGLFKESYRLERTSFSKTPQTFGLQGIKENHIIKHKIKFMAFQDILALLLLQNLAPVFEILLLLCRLLHLRILWLQHAQLFYTRVVFQFLLSYIHLPSNI